MRILLSHFRAFEECALDLAPLTLVHGPNGSVKSSPLQALSAAVLGRHAWTDRAGRGLAGQFREGAEEAVLRVEGFPTANGEAALARTITHGTQTLEVEGFAGNSSAQQKALLDRIGAAEGIVSLALGVERFIDLPTKDQTEILARVTGRGLTMEDIEIHFARAGIDMGEACLFFADDIETITADDLESAYKSAFQTRAGAKKRLADLDARAKAGAPPRVAAVPKDIKEPEIRKRLADLESKERDLLEEATRAREAERIREAGVSPKEIPKLKKIHDDLVARIEPMASRLREVEEEKNIPTLGFDPAQGFPAPAGVTCPILAGCCVADPFRFEKAAKEAAATLAARRKGIEAAKSLAERLRNELGRLTKEVGGIRERISLAETLAKTGEPTRPLAEIEAGLAEIRARLAKGREILLDARAASRAVAVDHEALSTARAEVALLEKICAALAPDARGSLVAGRAKEALALIARRIEEITVGEYSAEISLAPDLAICISRRGHYESQPLASLSTSERLRADIVLRDAISVASGVRVLVVDDADALDEASLIETLAYLSSRADAYDAILVGLAATVPPPTPEGWKIIDMGAVDHAAALAEEGA